LNITGERETKSLKNIKKLQNEVKLNNEEISFGNTVIIVGLTMLSIT